jgi:predicted RecB family nuclease
MLYDLVACPHRVTMDLFGDPSKRDEPNPFVQLLWEKGSIFENEVISRLEIPFLDLSNYADEERERLTLEAIDRGEPLIYGARIRADGLLGVPDLLRKEPGGYIAGDIKSGAGEEGPEDISKPKMHYAVQLGLYTDILERKGYSPGRRAFIWDVHGKEVIYDFTEVYGQRNPRILWQDYQECLAKVQAIVGEREQTLPAYAGICKLCHWYSACLDRLSKDDDLTLIPELGRSKRDVMHDDVPTIRELAGIDPTAFMSGKKTLFPGIGPDSLLRFHERAILLTTEGAKPFLRAQIQLPEYDRELFFDIEVDPMRDVCYLHGFVERHLQDHATEKFVAFFAEEPTPDEERRAFGDAIGFIRNSRPCSIYYYSKYERTIYRKLQEKYPDICTIEDIEDIFDPSHAVDLYYDVVKKATEWPTHDFSIKTLARYLGFTWRDAHPSGAASIEWFDRWVKTGDTTIRQRILDYNEDDCIATRVLLDGIRAMQEV